MPSVPAQHAPVVDGDAINDVTLIIFGASGDLTARKLIPALYRLWTRGFLTDQAAIIGVARREKSDDVFRNEMQEAVGIDETEEDSEKWEAFSKLLFYREADVSDAEQFQQLKSVHRDHRTITRSVGTAHRVHGDCSATFSPRHRSTRSSGHDSPTARRLRDCGSCSRNHSGHDLESAQELTQSLSRILEEQQIYRIDHYLGKETVQNILLFRFGNAIFEPLFNRTHVDHIQITVAESQGMERGRGAYYDESGALRDVLQNHVLQLLCLVTMEPPALFTGENIRDEKLKILQALRPGAGNGDIDHWAVRAQYAPGDVDGEMVVAYTDEERVPDDSTRETYVAMHVEIDNWRWAGVPFYLRTGKRLKERVTEVAIQFHRPPLNLFTTVECEGDLCEMVDSQPNTLIFRIQPHESISLAISTKRPGMQYQIHPVKMDFEYEDAFSIELPEAYERLLLDVMRGDSTLFTRSDELEAAWQFVTPVLNAWEQSDVAPPTYPASSWGPQEADELLKRVNRQWRRPAPNANRG